METDAALLAAAWQARKAAYAPYSGFAVGAALLAEDGRIFTGCNIENLSYGLTNCAERVAVQTAIAAGVKKFLKIAIVADTEVAISPCGACRQVLAEFAPDLLILSEGAERIPQTWKLSDLLPRPAAGILNRAPR